MLIAHLALSLLLCPTVPGSGTARKADQVVAPFAFDAPAGWERAPVGLAEESVRARWLDRNPVSLREPESGWTDSLRTRLDVYVFPAAGSVDAQSAEREHAGYLARMRSGRPGQRVEIRADEKDTSRGSQDFHGEITIHRTATRALEARSFDVGEDRVVLHCEGLISHRDELVAILERASASFRELRPGQRNGIELAPPRPICFPLDLADPSSSEAHKRARELGLAAREWLRAAAPDGWRTLDEGPARVLFQSDEKYARELARTGLGAWKFMETHFGAVARGGEPRAPLVTLFSDAASFSSVHPLDSALDAPLSLPFAIVAYDDDRANGSRAYHAVAGGFARAWLRERDPDLADALPEWLRNGLDRMMRCAREKGGKVTFEPDHWEAIGIQAAQNRDRVVPVEVLLRDGLAPVQGGSAEDRESFACQASQLLRFLSVGGGAKDKRLASVLPEYLKHLRAVVDELRPEVEAALAPAKADGTRGALEAQLSVRQRAWRERAHLIRARVFERTFAKWTDADWARFDAAYRATY